MHTSRNHDCPRSDIMLNDEEIQHAWALSVCKEDSKTVSGNLLNMIMDSGAEEQVVSLADWKRLGEPLLKRCATVDDMGVFGSCVVRGWCEDKLVDLPGHCVQLRNW